MPFRVGSEADASSSWWKWKGGLPAENSPRRRRAARSGGAPAPTLLVEPAAAMVARRGGSGSKDVVLVVDDTALNRKLLTLMVTKVWKEFGVVCFVVFDGFSFLCG